MFVASELDEHVELVCPMQLVWCRKWCGVKVPRAHREQHEKAHHVPVGPICKYKCGIPVPVALKQQHEQQECPFRHHPDWAQPYMPTKHRPAEFTDEHKHNWADLIQLPDPGTLTKLQPLAHDKSWRDSQLTPGVL